MALGVAIPPIVMIIGSLLGSKILIGLYLYIVHWLVLLFGMGMGLRGIVAGWIIGTVLMILSLPYVAINLVPGLA